jgi:LPXTG-site transpeptidase (sortase) family protein
MKKIKMFLIKLAFAALFFTTIAGLPFSLGRGENNGVSVSKQKEKKGIVTTFIQDAIQAANAQAETEEPALLLVHGKPYSYRITIPSLRILAGVVGMGLTPDGKMAVPDNYTEVGWYNRGAEPGTRGSSVMGAHVDNGGNIGGVFKNLKKLKVGQSIYITAGDGSIYEYKVTARKVYNYKTKFTDEVFAQKDTERLNLITCYGKWLPKENTYNQRLVVYTKLVKTTVASR